MAQAAIELLDLTKHYGGHRGVEGLSLAIEPGEIFGFLGPNGAGKTTTIRLLLDLLRPTRGRARILGLDCRADGIAVRRSVGYLPGEYTLYENMSGRQLVRFFAALRDQAHEVPGERVAARIGATLDRPIRTLSHGNKQKLAIVLALMSSPAVLILDEPTNGLDPLAQQEFFALVAENRAAGGTVFLSSHNLTEVERVCDRVASVREGRLVAVDAVDALHARALRIVRLRCARPPAAAAFAHLSGVTDLQIEGQQLTCSVQGPLGALLAAAAAYELVDVLSREASLEEFFLTLYGKQRHGDVG